MNTLLEIVRLDVNDIVTASVDCGEDSKGSGSTCTDDED